MTQEAPAMKFCKDCKHFRNLPPLGRGCFSPRSPREPVYGYPDVTPSDLRYSKKLCGPDAAWFEERPPEPPPLPAPPEPPPSRAEMLHMLLNNPPKPWWRFWL